MLRYLVIIFTCLPAYLLAQSNLKVEVGDTEVTFHSSSAFGLRGARSQRLRPKDIASFKYLGGAYSKDKYQVYFYKQIVKEADPVTFFCLGSRNDVYPEFNPFPAMKSYIGADTQNVYFMSDMGSFGDYVQNITVMDRKSFGIVTVLDSINASYLVRNQQQLYVIQRDLYDRTNVIPTDLVEKNITLLGGPYFLNGKMLYHEISPIFQVKPGVMKVYVNSRYITDGKKVYYYKYSLDPLPADYASFTVHPVYKAFARDKKNYYVNGEKIETYMYAFEAAKEMFSTKVTDPAKHREFLRMSTSSP